MNNKRFKILSLDGGGIGGLYSATMLKKIEDNLHVDIYNEFDLLAGSSVGSIIAGAIASKIDLMTLTNIFLTQSQKIFQKRGPFSGIFNSRYSNKFLKSKLEEMLLDTTLSDIQKPLIITAVDILNSKEIAFCSFEEESFSPLKNCETLLSDVILASSCAPILFEPHKINGTLLVDGGLWANNPTLLAACKAKEHFGVKLEDISVLSIGTGIESNRYIKDGDSWGATTNYRADKLHATMISLQINSTNSLAHTILNDILRVSANYENNLHIDSPNEIDKIVKQANSDYELYEDKLKSLFKKE